MNEYDEQRAVSSEAHNFCDIFTMFFHIRLSTIFSHSIENSAFCFRLYCFYRFDNVLVLVSFDFVFYFNFFSIGNWKWLWNTFNSISNVLTVPHKQMNGNLNPWTLNIEHWTLNYYSIREREKERERQIIKLFDTVFDNVYFCFCHLNLKFVCLHCLFNIFKNLY